MQSFAIMCNGIELPFITQIVSLLTIHSLDGAGQAVLSCVVDPPGGDATTAMNALPLGGLLSVRIGNGDEMKEVFAGRVQTHRLDATSVGVPQFVLTATSWSAPATLDDVVVLTAQYGATVITLACERAWSDSERTELSGGRSPSSLQGNVLLPGTTRARLGALMSLGGVGSSMGGDVRIVGIHQSLDSGGWTTRVHFRKGSQTDF